LSGPAPAAFELDGEWIGRLPVTFGLDRQALRVVVP
jgi:diacylglycerol kinase family enzyme